jgi:cobaltochelatase CobT
MNSKVNNLIEKFKIALTSTAKVISDDLELNKLGEKQTKKEDIIDINDLIKPSDFIRLRAETDSAALKKNFLITIFIKKTYPLTPHQSHYTT